MCNNDARRTFAKAMVLTSSIVDVVDVDKRSGERKWTEKQDVTKGYLSTTNVRPARFNDLQNKRGGAT